jgi:hypothetical protein
MAAQASSPLAMHCSYRATKSPLVTVGVDEDGGISGKIGGKVFGCASSRNRLVHVGATREPMPSTPSEGEVWGEGHVSCVPASLYLPSTHRGGRQSGRGKGAVSGLELTDLLAPPRVGRCASPATE